MRRAMGRKMSTMISEFRGEQDWLSNFYPINIRWEGRKYQTVEHAFQASKTLSEVEREEIRKAPTPGLAKRKGRQVIRRVDWEQVRVGIMLDLLRLKFAERAKGKLREKLLATGDAELVESNDWGDMFWGVCNGIGENKLGRLLMQVRREIREGIA